MATLCQIPAQRGRPREFDMDVALAAALRVFWRNGYEGASLTELTQEMGITKPSLYAAFGNKESLFRKAFELYECEKLAYVGQALDAPTSREVAERLLMSAIDMQASGCDPKGCLGVISAVTCGPEADSIRQEVLSRRLSSLKAMVDRFERAVAEGDLPADIDPEALARYLSAIMQGLSVQARSGANCTELGMIARTTLALWPRAEGR